MVGPHRPGWGADHGARRVGGDERGAGEHDVHTVAAGEVEAALRRRAVGREPAIVRAPTRGVRMGGRRQERGGPPAGVGSRSWSDRSFIRGTDLI